MTSYSATAPGAGGKIPTPVGLERAVIGASSFELRKLWLTLAHREWTSLAVIPTASGTSSRPLATALVEAGGQCGARAVLVDADQCDLAGSARVLKELATSRSVGARVVVAVDCLLVSLAAIQVALATDSVLLLVPYGDSDFNSVRTAVDIVGRERILGCVTLRRT